MSELMPTRVAPWVFGALLGTVLGFFMFNDHDQILALRSQLDQARMEMQRNGRARPAFAAQGITSADNKNGKGSPAIIRSNYPSASRQRPLLNEENELERAMRERSKTGEYHLMNEYPFNRNFRDKAAKSLAATIGSNRAPELGQLFSSFGLDPEVSQQLQDHRKKINEAVVQAEGGTLQLLKARKDYDDRVRSLLSEEDYAKYYQYEASRPAQSEYDKVKQYARQQNVTLDPNYQSSIVSLIQQTKAYTEPAVWGPYDNLPQPLVGRADMIAYVQGVFDDLTAKRSQIAAQAGAAGLPDEYKNVLDAYFQQTIMQKQTLIAKLNSPPNPDAQFEEMRRRMQRQKAAPP